MPEEKLAGYALDPAHPRGRHKARVFSSALGIEQTDWRYLRDQLIEGIMEAAVLGTRITPFGVLYEVMVRPLWCSQSSTRSLGGCADADVAGDEAPPLFTGQLWTHAHQRDFR